MRLLDGEQVDDLRDLVRPFLERAKKLGLTREEIAEFVWTASVWIDEDTDKRTES